MCSNYKGGYVWNCTINKIVLYSPWLKLSHHLQLRKLNLCKILPGRKMRISPLTIISYPQPIPPLQASVATNTSPLDIQLDPTESKPSPMTQSVPHISFKEAHLQDMVMDLEISLSVPVEDLELTYNYSITSIDTPTHLCKSSHCHLRCVKKSMPHWEAQHHC